MTKKKPNEIVLEKVDSIRAYDENAKKHPDDQVKKIAKSIDAFGFNQPIAVDKDGYILAGHGRLQAAILLGMEKVPVLHTDLDGQEAKAYRLADNKLNESEWDMSLVKDELRDLTEELRDLTGFERDILVTDEDKDEEMPDIPDDRDVKSKKGQLYQLGDHRLLCGDATALDDVEKLMGDVKVDSFVTDPPYNVDYTGKTNEKLKIDNDDMDNETFRKLLVDAFTNAHSVMKEGAVFYIWHADSEGYTVRGAVMDAGFSIRQNLIWKKNKLVMGRQDYHWQHEPCLYGWKDGSAHLWNTDRKQTTILEFDRPQSSKEHPTMKPVALISYQVSNNTKGEDVVLDIFGGGGSTLIACEKLGRHCYMMELDPKYVDVIIKRWEDHTGKVAELIEE
jgi:site-specific DNA-methyltransferase (adenine-specific)